MRDSPDNKKIVVAGVASILLVAAVVAVVVGATQPSTANIKEVQKGLVEASATVPKELIKVAFNTAVKSIADVLNNSVVLKEAAANPKTKEACNVCHLVLDTAVDDLQRSIDNVDVLGAKKASDFVEDIKVWLGAVIANQETCIESIAETSTETSEKMQNVLSTAREFSSKGLAMVSGSASILPTFGGGGRKLLAGVPEFAKRRLLLASRIDLEPTIVVAKDGSGDFKTIGEAIASLPEKSNDSVVIHVKAGLYNEEVRIPKKVNNVMLVGDGRNKTRITGSKSYAGGVTTYQSATVGVDSDDFLAKDIAFENTAGPDGHQAVALRVSGDKAIFFNVAIDGYQDTLYAHTYRQYYRNCIISGTVDFTFGHSLAIFQNCEFRVRKPGKDQSCMVTADGKVDKNAISGIVIQNGSITAEQAFLTAQPPHKAFLGRPWKELSTTIIMQSDIGGFIDPTGWSPWSGTFGIDTCYYAEYKNRGPGSNTTGRVQWKGIRKLTPEMAQSWTGGEAFAGDEWIKQSGVPYIPTMMQV